MTHHSSSINLATVDIIQLISQTFYVMPKGRDTYTTLEHDSLIIWPRTNTFRWFSKNIGGGPEQWLKYALHLNESEYEEYTDGLRTVILGDENEPEFVKNFPIGHRRYTDYVRSRNISKATSDHYKLESWHKDVILPMYSNTGTRIGSILRRSDTNVSYLKYRKIQIAESCNVWPQPSLYERFDKPVFLFEGGWSAMRWWQVAQGQICTLALIGLHAGDATHKLLNGVENVHIILDRDKTKSGHIVMNKLKESRYYDKEAGWKFVLPDEYPDEMGDDKIKWYIQKYAPGLEFG